MKRLQLTDYQAENIKRFIDSTNQYLENKLLEKYNVFSIEELNATDYDEILEKLQNWSDIYL